ncbi:MAG: peptidase [Pseudomonadota bacterium]
MDGWQGNETLTVRLGERDYAVDRDWAGLAAAGTAGSMSDLAAVGGDLWVLQRAEPPILVFDRAGRPQAQHGAGEVFDGHGLTADGRGGAYVVDRDAHEILHMAGDGVIVRRFGQRHRPDWTGPFNHPTAVAPAADGSLWVADGYGNARVHHLAPDGTLRLSFGGLGTEPGSFVCPHALCLSPDGRVLVVDRDMHRVQVFDPDGGLLDVWTGFFRPMAIAMGPDGWVYVTDQVPSLQRIAPDGSSRSRARPARNQSHGLAIADDGTIWLTDTDPRCLVRMRPLGD